MIRLSHCFKKISFIVCVYGIICLLSGVSAAQDDEVAKPRGIVPVFETVRPNASRVKPSKLPTKINQKINRPTYNRISQKIDSGKIGKDDRPNSRPPKPQKQKPPVDIQIAGAQQIGVTLWKLLTTNFKGGNGNEEYFPQINGGRTRYLTPSRASINTLFEAGDYVRLAIEAAKRGYLYVVDQEMYADGSMGEAFLIFPNKRLRGGANLITPGNPIEIPDAINNPFYFELRPQSQDGKSIMAEVLTVIITDRPIAGLQISDQPLLISNQMLGGWRTKWSGPTEIFEPQEKSNQQGYSTAERSAATGKQKLSANDPLPQTVFLLEANRQRGALITIPLWYGKE